MNLIEAINITNFGEKHILLSDKNGEEYYYKNIDKLEKSKEYKELSELEVLSIDCSDEDRIVFYLW